MGNLPEPGPWQDEAAADWVFHLPPRAVDGPRVTRRRAASNTRARVLMDAHLLDAVAAGATRAPGTVGGHRNTHGHRDVEVVARSGRPSDGAGRQAPAARHVAEDRCPGTGGGPGCGADRVDAKGTGGHGGSICIPRRSRRTHFTWRKGPNEELRERSRLRNVWRCVGLELIHGATHAQPTRTVRPGIRACRELRERVVRRR